MGVPKRKTSKMRLRTRKADSEDGGGLRSKRMEVLLHDSPMPVCL